MLLLVLACLSCVLLAWLRCAFGAAFSSTAAYFAIKPMHAPHRPTILLNCHSDNFVRLALQDELAVKMARRSLGKMTGFGVTCAPAWQNRRFGAATRRRVTRIAGLVPRRGVGLPGSQVWYRAAAKRWQNHRIWYFLVARSAVWYPPSGKTASLVPKKARCEFPDLVFLRAPGTKLANLAEIGEPNRRSCQ